MKRGIIESNWQVRVDFLCRFLNRNKGGCVMEGQKGELAIIKVGDY